MVDCSIVGNRSGGSDAGGGIYISTSGTITNCFVANNRSLKGGGVASTVGSSSYNAYRPHILGCVISNNVAQLPDGETGKDGNGGGIHSTNCSKIDGCLVTHNEARKSAGSGVYYGGIQTGAGIILRNTVIEYNKAIEGYGGGCGIGSTVGIITNCLFVGNSASSGGGLVISGGGLVVDCTIISNSTAAFIQGGTLRNSLVAYNTNGIRVEATGTGTGLFQNCTIFGNGDTGINFLKESLVENCIITGHAQNNWVYNNAGGENTVWLNSCTTPLPTGTSDVGNIVEDPKLVDPANGDYSLQGSSPCINKGIYRDWMAGAFDLQGKNRIIGPAVDIGAFEAPLPLGTLFIIL